LEGKTHKKARKQALTSRAREALALWRVEHQIAG
jgi:hypothetical protein